MPPTEPAPSAGEAVAAGRPLVHAHSSNRASVMYFAVDPSLPAALFGSASDRYDA